MVSQRFGGVSLTDDLDQLLQQRAKETQQYPPQSPQRQLVLNRLVDEVLKSGRIGRPQREVWSASLYEDFYNDALQKTLLEICQKIDKYNPEHPFMAWVNFRLNCHFVDVVNDYAKKGITHVPKSTKTEQVAYLLSLDDLDKFVPSEETTSDDQLLRKFLEDDPENLLKKHRLRERPEITFQLLALAKFVEGKTWLEIATDLGVSVQTLCSFFNRRLQELIPYFKKYLQEY
ncbi:MAG: sigma-70 family RNA polymerase sigma factor [Leptolyngbyaceae cyanobacterium RU_5_1]|nr:sigma-70 family RNA polymerase sigma factor [Leptolyngbyaceae cyanobacterium RU_5_1]